MASIIQLARELSSKKWATKVYLKMRKNFIFWRWQTDIILFGKQFDRSRP